MCDVSLKLLATQVFVFARGALDKYLWERIQIFLRSASKFHASCGWFGPGWTVCALTACQRASSSIDGRVLILAGMVAELTVAMKESRQARFFMSDNVMSVGGSLSGGRL